MFSDIQLALARMALHAYDYRDAPAQGNFNRTGIPDGWTKWGSERRNDVSGFLGHAFLDTSGTRLVVSFAGTRFDPSQDFKAEPDNKTNVNGGAGLSHELQFGDAVRFFRDLMSDSGIPDAAKQNVVFTGHSLGGGLAGFMGVLFDLPSLGFAAAPFQFKTMRPDSVSVGTGDETFMEATASRAIRLMLATRWFSSQCRSMAPMASIRVAIQLADTVM